MMEWIRKNDVLYKAVALLAAILLWFYVITVENPETELPYDNVDVVLEGMESLTANGLVITDGAAPTVDMRLSGERDKMNKVNRDKITVTASVASITLPGEYKLSYNIKVDVADVQVTSKTPTQITLTVDRLTSRSIPVNAIFSGQPAENYRSQGYTLSPDAIKVSGPETVLAQIDHAEIRYDLEGATASVETNLTYRLIDVDGREVDTTRISVDTPSVKLDVDIKQLGSVPLVVEFISSDYLTSDMIQYVINPSSISIVGEADTVSTINQIDLGDISLKNVVENNIYRFEMPIILPNGVTAAADTPAIAEVLVTTPGYSRSVFMLSQNAFNKAEGITYPEQTLEIDLFGPDDDVAALSEASFSVVPAQNIDNLEEGEHTLPVNVSCSNGNIHIFGRYSIQIIKESAPEPEPEPEPEE